MVASSTCRFKKVWASGIILIALHCFFPASSASAEPILDVAIGGQIRHLARDELLNRSDVTNVTIASDVAYGKAMDYRAIPMAALLAGHTFPANSVVESVALDGFVAQLPLDLVMNTDPTKAVAWLAIEPDKQPWPMLPGKAESAGPFYIVWTGASVTTIRSEQWPYQVRRLEVQASPIERWPALQVDPSLPATHSIRAGLALYVTQCLPCHTLSGAGASNVGPDLNQPKNPTQYMSPNGLHALIRDPGSVRSWPTMQMPGFDADHLSDEEIDLIVQYLGHMATRRQNP